MQNSPRRNLIPPTPREGYVPKECASNPKVIEFGAARPRGVRERVEPTREEIEDYVQSELASKREQAAKYLEAARALYALHPEWITGQEFPSEVLPHLRMFEGDPNYEPAQWSAADVFSPKCEHQIRAKARKALIELKRIQRCLDLLDGANRITKP
jgi:hypothetical protein